MENRHLPGYQVETVVHHIEGNDQAESPGCIAVARAAPVMPIAGKPRYPNINIGSSTAFIRPEKAMIIPGKRVFPAARMELFPTMGIIMKATVANQITM